jgi:hypothetical protein
MRCDWLFGSALVSLLLILGATQSPQPTAEPGPLHLVTYVPPRGYLCNRAAGGPIQVDGRLDKAVWRDAPWTDWFVDIEGDKKPRPRFKTRVKMLWDDQYFYVAAELEEPHVWATLTNHDAVIFHDNDFEVFIDPDGDSHDYAEFEINALNTDWDLLLTRPYKDGGRAINGWEIPGLKKAVHVDGTLNDPRDRDQGWTVELAIPWKALGELGGRIPRPQDGDQWRVNFSRVEWQHEIVDGKYRKVPGTKEDNWVWSPQGVVNMHRPEMWGVVQFSTAAPGSATFRPDPSGPARQVLHAVYYAQHAYRKAHGHWASTLRELDLSGISHASITGPPHLDVCGSLFEATVELRQPAGTKKRWHIRNDALVWSD